MAGVNKAERRFAAESFNLGKSLSANAQAKPCIFISHIAIDKKTAVSIGEYIRENADIDIYLDIFDENLQTAVSQRDAAKITSFIERGISSSTHIMCLIGERTAESWWVPYELGYAKKSLKELSALKLKGNIDLPAYLEIAEVLKGTRSLNAYLEKIVRNHQLTKSGPAINISLEACTKTYHPLDSYLDWNI